MHGGYGFGEIKIKQLKVSCLNYSISPIRYIKKVSFLFIKRSIPTTTFAAASTFQQYWQHGYLTQQPNAAKSQGPARYSLHPKPNPEP
jgi:hypothetical protein